ncbi:hypothetical protein CSPX01_09651, partial [Colletotrichum filicis]
LTRKLQRLYDWTDTQWQTDTNDYETCLRKCQKYFAITHTGTCGGSPWNKTVTGHRPWAQARNLPLPSVPSPTPPRLGTGLPLHLMFSIGHGSGTSILYLLFLLPNPPRDNRKGPKSGMAAQETSSGDTSPSSHALSSGPHDRDCSRCCTLCTSASLLSSPPPPDRPSFRPATRDWIEPHALCNTWRPELAFARPVMPLLRTQLLESPVRLVSTLNPSSSFSAQHPSIGLFGPWIDPRTLATKPLLLLPPPTSSSDKITSSTLRPSSRLAFAASRADSGTKSPPPIIKSHHDPVPLACLPQSLLSACLHRR